MGIVGFILGRRLANRELQQRKIGAFEGVPTMGLDGLGSSAYGPEAALTILMPLGAAGPAMIGWIMAPIVGLLIILCASYWQTIRAYPNNGGAYIVARENLGTNVSLLAAAALMIDYVLNSAVGISAGVGALVSAVPSLHGEILPLCLGILLVITLVNLRGTLDAGRVFALPTYLFIASFVAILAIGVLKAILAGGHPHPVVALPSMPKAAGVASLWLSLRAFASGCTAMTGVEAVSNGMSAFRDPPVIYGHRTLATIVGVLALLLVGIAYLSAAYGIGAMDQTQENYHSVLSLLAGAVIGNGVFYYIAVASLLCVLALSANTSFIDLPRLCRMVAEDGFLPKTFAIAGRRLVFSVGILFLAAATALLLVVFGGITDRLIPLFAIGAFLTFTLSQIGMAVHWHKAGESSDVGSNRRHFWINAVGGAATCGALSVIVIAKFTEGAWITILVIPCVIALLKVIRRYYDELAARMRDPNPLTIGRTTSPIILVAVQEWNRLTDRAITLALSLSPDVIAIHLTQLSGPEGEEHDRTLQAQWRTDVQDPVSAAGRNPPRMMTLQAQYRAIHEPVLKLIEELQTKFDRRVVVLIPEIVKRRWYQHLLHAHRARYLRTQLQRHGSGLTIINVPWNLDDSSSGNAANQGDAENKAG